MKRFGLAFALSLLAVGLAQEEEAAPEAVPETVTPAPPPPPPPPPAPVLTGEAALSGDELIAFHRNQFLQQVASAGQSAKKGAWLYGDYLNELPGVHDPVTCAQRCVADPKCYHWNFQVEKKRCDLKAPNGGTNDDIADWITGDMGRTPPVTDL
mmetsp:Transcript_100186/g.238922  ORF Transcript_100186/g.238922 Transcript_100186/m.238922 type:complete len:154 (+) Transcript_100186:87-548(+)